MTLIFVEPDLEALVFLKSEAYKG